MRPGHGTTVSRSTALAQAIRAEIGDVVEAHACLHATAVSVAVDGLLNLARQGHGAPVVESVLARVAEALDIIERED